MSETLVADQELNITFYRQGYPNQEVLKRSLPNWFTDYSSEKAALQMALYQSHIKSMSAQRDFRKLIQPLKSVHDFCLPLLRKNMQEQFGVSADCRQIWLDEVIATSSGMVSRSQPILLAALYNFEKNKNFHTGSSLYYRAEAYPPNVDPLGRLTLADVCGPKINCSTGRLDVEPADFAKMCRTLDLGGKYQAHLNSLFGPSDEAETPVSRAFSLKERTRFEVLCHIARMRNHLSEEVYKVMLEVANPDGKPEWRGGPVCYRELELKETPHAQGSPGYLLYGMFMIEACQPEQWTFSLSPHPGNEQRPVVVYMPGEPEHPLREYASVDEFLSYLQVKLGDIEYRNYFQRFIELPQHALFLDTLTKVSTPHPRGSRVIQLSLNSTPVHIDPFALLYDQARRKLRRDADVLAVPTARKTSPSTPSAFELFKMVAHLGFDLADIFLPASEVRDLAEDVFIAVEDWTDGEQEDALSQLYEIGKDVVLALSPKIVKEVERLEKIYEDGKQTVEFIQEMLNPSATNGGGPQGPESSLDEDEITELEQDNAQGVPNRVRPSAFIESLVQVKTAAGATRLWNPVLDRFEHLSPLPKGTFLNRQSLFQAGGKTWLSMGGHYYQISFDPALNKWRVLNADGLQGYSPILETNDAGAWRFEWENPMGWDANEAFRRLHGDLVPLDDATIDHILRITEIDEAQLRLIHVDKLAPPALLVDCCLRFLIARQVSDSIRLLEQISDSSPSGSDDAFFVPDIAPYLDFLVSMPGWPDDRVLRRVDAQGNVLSRHGLAPTASSNIDVIYIPGRMNRFLDALVGGLSPIEAELLLINYQPPRTPGQYLAWRMASEATGRRKMLFDLIYGSRNASTDNMITLFKRDFPSLPNNVIREIIGFADKSELDLLRVAGRIPLRQAEQARIYLQRLRLNRALECFYLHMETPDSSTVALGLINSMPDWPQNLVLEVRRHTFEGERLFRSGAADNPSAPVDLVFVQSGPDFQTFNGQGQRVYLQDKGLHRTLASALSDRANVTRDVHNLELFLGDLATSQRSRVKRILGLRDIKPTFIAPWRLSDGRVGYPLSGRLRGLFARFRNNASSFSPELAVKKLYPQFTARQIQDFLEQLSATYVGSTAQKSNLVRARLNELAAEYSALESTLDGWLAEARRAQNPGATADGREVARLRMLSCWRKEAATLVDPASEVSGFELDLSNLAIGALPAITANFDHVRVLTLDNLGLTASDVDAFLRRFAQARWLSLRSNQMETVPEGLAYLSNLTRLVLSNNSLRVDAQGMQILRRLTLLKILAVEGQGIHISGTVDVRVWSELIELKLRGCGLTAMPVGLGASGVLRHVDLRHNDIIDIDEATLRAIAARTSLYVRLHQNPLNAETIARAQAIFDETRLIRMGIMDVPGQPTQAQAMAQWPAGTGDDAQRRYWAELQLERDGEAFVQLVNDLFWTAEYRDNRLLLTVRLWRMIDAMRDSALLQAQLFRMAAHPQTCADGTMIVFNQLDVRVLVYLLESAHGTVTPVQMFNLMRGLERLDELERIALEDFNARVTANPRLDQVEVRLIYPTMLRDELDLPGQAHTMLFDSISGVTQDMLDRARDRVLARESTPEFFASMIAREDWVTFLQLYYPQRFEAVNQPFHDRQDRLDMLQKTMTDSAYVSESNTVALERKQAIDVLAIQLTSGIARLASDSTDD
ncbi:MAG TPA: NEL-type E3 ubiquitin ligase domain-containing protein [Pseudomonas sp.]|jgi:hypothetical protein